MKFELDTTDGRARRGRLVFDRGVVETPCFMPVGTYGTVKKLKPLARKLSSATPSTCGCARARKS